MEHVHVSPRPRVTVNGVEITQAAIAAETQNHPAPDAESARAEAVRALVIRELLLQEARRLALVAEPRQDEEGRRETDEEAQIRALLDREITTPEADAASCRRYYDNNRRRFTSEDIYEAAHILLSAAPEDKVAYEAAEREAKAIIDVLIERPTLFADMARERSACPSGAEGGNLGQLTRGQTVAEFETFLFALDEGQLCPVPVKTRYGVHVLRLDRKIAGRTLPFEAVKDEIARYLAEASWHRAAYQYVRILAGRAEIAGADVEGSQGPLVQ
ncbi:MAG: peptidylprolyl isomerase [Candidatus Eiseniibacteriota bacterium]